MASPAPAQIPPAPTTADHTIPAHTAQSVTPAENKDPRTTPALDTDFMLSPMITIVVSKKSKAGRFDAHTSLLKSESGFFRGCLVHNFVEAASGVIRFPEDRIDDFIYFLKWLYSGNLTVAPTPLEITKDSWPILFRRYLRAYVLGNKLICPRYQNAVVEKMMKLFPDYTNMPPNALQQLLALGLGDTKLMKFLVKRMAYSYVVNQEQAYVDEKHHSNHAISWKNLLPLDLGLTQQILKAKYDVGIVTRIYRQIQKSKNV
jgi:hypothetical protein